MKKKMKEALAALGPNYTTKAIDWELCIYRNLGNGFDIEVSGMDNNRYTKYSSKGRLLVPYCSDIWVWDMRPGFPQQTVVNVRNVKDLPELIDVLERLSAKFSDPDYIVTLNLEKMQSLGRQGGRLLINE